MRRFFFPFLFFFLLTLLIYKDLYFSVYQQDEWHALGFIKSEGLRYLITQTSFIGLFLFESRIFARLVNMGLFGYFGLNTFPLFLFSIFFHALNASLVFILFKKILKKEFIAFIASLFFLINDTSKQAIIWYGTATGTLPSTTTILLAIISYIAFIEKKKLYFYFLSIICIFISIAFKETAIFLFIFLPFLDFLLKRYQKEKSRSLKPALLLLLGGVLYITLKIINIFFLRFDYSGYVSSSNGNAFYRLLWTAISYPVETLSQLLIPDAIFYPFSQKFTFAIFPYFEQVGYATQVSEKVVVELLSVLATLLIFTPLIFFVLMKRKNKLQFWIFSGLYLLSFLPFIVIKKTSGYLESRYYYTIAIPFALFVGIFIDALVAIVKKKLDSNLYKLSVIIPISIFVLFLFWHVKYIHKQLAFQKEKADVQKPILAFIATNMPSGKKQIYYIESDRDFVVEGNPLPFQQGIGYMLLVLRAEKGDKSALLYLNNNFFWELGNQGYKEKNGTGFGYYSDFGRLALDLKKYKINPQTVTAFSYNSETKKMTNVSLEIQRRLNK